MQAAYAEAVDAEDDRFRASLGTLSPREDSRPLPGYVGATKRKLCKLAIPMCHELIQATCLTFIALFWFTLLVGVGDLFSFLSLLLFWNPIVVGDIAGYVEWG